VVIHLITEEFTFIWN